MASKVNFDTSETLNIVCREGDTFSMSLTLKDSAGTGLTLSTDQYKFYMQVRTIVQRDVRGKEKGVETVIMQTPGLTKEVDENILSFEDPTSSIDDSGNVTIEASAEVMSKIKPGTYAYDLKYVKPSTTGLDVHKGILRGSFTVNAQITDIY